MISPRDLGINPIDETEVFKPAHYNGVDYPNYLISNFGRLYSYKTQMILKAKRIKQGGYIAYRASINGKRQEFLMHRMVAFAFVNNPKPEEYKIVNHISEDPADNRASNLEWCNDKMNLNHRGAQVRRAAKRSYTTEIIDKYGFVRATFISANEAARIFGVNAGSVSCACHSGKPYRGYYWRYADREATA